MSGGGVEGRLLGMLMIVTLPSAVEAGDLVKDGCKTFGRAAVGGWDDVYFGMGCHYACRATYNGPCPATDRTPTQLYTKCVRTIRVSSSHLRLPDCCVARALRHLTT